MITKLVRKFQRTNELDGRTYDRELSPLAVEQGVVINKDRSLGYGFRLDAPYTPTLSDEALASLYGNHRAAASDVNDFGHGSSYLTPLLMKIAQFT